jgi:hypothetical protein
MSAPLYIKPAARFWPSTITTDLSVARFHHSLPDYAPTRTFPLDSIAEELGFGHVLLKDESNRFSLRVHLQKQWLCTSRVLVARQPSSLLSNPKMRPVCKKVCSTENYIAFHRENDYDWNELRNRFGVIMAPTSTGGGCRAHGDLSRGPLRHT